MPFYEITNTQTGFKRVIATLRKPSAGGKAFGNSEMNASRRKVIGDTAAIKASWVVRSKCVGGKKPTSCRGDLDVSVPFQCQFDILTC